jgi:putative ABC transport system permease protein
MKMLGLAFRNLLRNRRRSLATLLAIAIGSAAILMFGGYSANIKYSMQTAYVRSGGHLQIQHRDYFLYGSGNPTAYGIDGYKTVMDALQQDATLRPMIRVVTPSLQFGGIGGNYGAGVSRTVVGVGVRAPDVNRMRAWNEYDLPLHSPVFALEGARPDAAIIGKGVARVLQLCEALGIDSCPRPEIETRQAGKALPNDIAQLAALEGKATAAGPSSAAAKIELLSSSPNGTPNVAQLSVLKAENQGFKELDDVLVTLHLDQAQRLIFGRTSPKVTSILVQLESTSQVAAARQKIESLLPTLGLKQTLATLDFEHLNPFYVQTVQLFNTIFGFIFTLIGAIVLFTVGNTMNTAVVERTVEIGTLRAIGVRQQGIRTMFIIEGLLIGLAGALTGAIAAILIAGAVNQAGLTWLPPGSAEPLPLILRVWGEAGMIVGTTLGLIAVSAVSAWWPARRAARLNVVDALRHA